MKQYMYIKARMSYNTVFKYCSCIIVNINKNKIIYSLSVDIKINITSLLE